MKQKFTIVLALVILSSSLLVGFIGSKAEAIPGSPDIQSSNEFLTNFSETLDIVQKNYAEDVGPDRLVYSAIKGMLRSLDPHSNFFDPKEFAGLREDQKSLYYGLGIKVQSLQNGQGRVVILEPPIKDTPAARSGLHAGDVITHIEGDPIDAWALDKVISHLKGPRGTEVNITVERPGVQESLKFAVERNEIPIITVPYAFEVKPGIGYIKIDKFSELTADDFRVRTTALEVEKLSGLILDLRNNPGGLLNQAIAISEFFLPRNEIIVSTKGRIRGSSRTFSSRTPEEIKIPLIILMNGGSASASEIVAGALQDHDRALILGETSFGKGLVQTVYPLDSDTGLALTTAKYYTPSGRLIQRDYSLSTFDYLNMKEGNADLTEGASGREIKETDSGRTVLGGGGITPDIVEPPGELGRFEAILTSKRVFFQYAIRLISGQVTAAESFSRQLEKREAANLNDTSPGLLPHLEIDEEILGDFKKYLRSRAIEFTDQDIINNKNLLKRRIKQEVYTLSFGPEEGFKIGVQGDRQVLKALEVLPEAKLLMTSGRINPGSKIRNN